MYHATAKNNYDGILKEGFLLIDKRGKTPFGLDADIDYGRVYGSEEKAKPFIKPPCIHLGADAKETEEYLKLINTLNVDAVLLEVDVDPVYLKSDSESKKGYIYLKNIPVQDIKCVAVRPNIAANIFLITSLPTEEQIQASSVGTLFIVIEENTILEVDNQYDLIEWSTPTNFIKQFLKTKQMQIKLDDYIAEQKQKSHTMMVKESLSSQDLVKFADFIKKAKALNRHPSPRSRSPDFVPTETDSTETQSPKTTNKQIRRSR
jgi:hypothetical protein